MFPRRQSRDAARDADDSFSRHIPISSSPISPPRDTEAQSRYSSLDEDVLSLSEKVEYVGDAKAQQPETGELSRKFDFRHGQIPAGVEILGAGESAVRTCICKKKKQAYSMHTYA
jgi:hypothetical protein